MIDQFQQQNWLQMKTALNWKMEDYVSKIFTISMKQVIKIQKQILTSLWQQLQLESDKGEWSPLLFWARKHGGGSWAGLRLTSSTSWGAARCGIVSTDTS